MTVILTLTMAISTILRNVLSGRGLQVEGFEEPEPDEDEEENQKTVQEPFENEEEEEDSAEGMLPSEKPNPNPTQTQLMDNLRTNALDLQGIQTEIINGFEKIEPYMDKAESLIEDIQKTALTIQDMRSKQTTQRPN